MCRAAIDSSRHVETRSHNYVGEVCVGGGSTWSECLLVRTGRKVGMHETRRRRIGLEGGMGGTKSANEVIGLCKRVSLLKVNESIGPTLDRVDSLSAKSSFCLSMLNPRADREGTHLQPSLHQQSLQEKQIKKIKKAKKKAFQRMIA